MTYVDNLPFNGAFPWQPVRLPAWNSVAACCLGAVLIDRFIWNHRGFQLRHFFRLGDWRSGDIWRYLERPEEFHWFSRPGNQGTCFINLSFDCSEEISFLLTCIRCLNPFISERPYEQTAKHMTANMQHRWTLESQVRNIQPIKITSDRIHRITSSHKTWQWKITPCTDDFPLKPVKASI